MTTIVVSQNLPMARRIKKKNTLPKEETRSVTTNGDLSLGMSNLKDYWFSFLSIAVLLIGLVTTTYLVQRQQQLNSRAAGGPILQPIKLKLTSTYNSIGIEVPFNGDDTAIGTPAAATVQYREITNPPSSWKDALPLWRTKGAVDAKTTYTNQSNLARGGNQEVLALVNQARAQAISPTPSLTLTPTPTPVCSTPHTAVGFTTRVCINTPTVVQGGTFSATGYVTSAVDGTFYVKFIASSTVQARNEQSFEYNTQAFTANVEKSYPLTWVLPINEGVGTHTFTSKVLDNTSIATLYSQQNATFDVTSAPPTPTIAPTNTPVPPTVTPTIDPTAPTSTPTIPPTSAPTSTPSVTTPVSVPTVDTAFYGSILQLSPNKTYEVKVSFNDPDATSPIADLVAQISTKNDSVKSAAQEITDASIASLLYHVRSSGNDTTGDGRTSATAWATLCKAMKSAPSGAVVQVGPGNYMSPNNPANNVAGCDKDFIRTSPIKLIAENQAVNDNQQEQNKGQRSVIEYGTYSSPTGSGGLNPGRWVQVPLIGKTTGTAYNDIWMWDPGFGTSYPAVQMGYAQARDDQPTRISSWDIKLGTITDGQGRVWEIQTKEGWVDVLHNNKKYNYGFATFEQNGDPNVYLRMPNDVNPNNYYLYLVQNSGNGSSGLTFNAPNIRVSGFEMRLLDVRFNSGVTGGIVDHNLFISRGINLVGSKPDLYGSSQLIERNKFVDTSLFSPTGTSTAGQYIPWTFIKYDIIIDDGSPTGLSAPWARVGSGSGEGLGAEYTAVTFTGGSTQVVIRNNVVDGFFNGIGANNSGYDRYSSMDVDIHNNTFKHINDDAFEPEQQVINWRMWNNRIEDSAVALSTGPVFYGPLYFFRNEVFRVGGHGNVPDGLGNRGTTGQGFKFSAGGADTKARIFVINNTFWTDTQGVSGGTNAAGGGINPERFYVRNNIFRMTRYAFDEWTSSPGALDNPWDENHNYFYSSDPTRTMGSGGTRNITLDTYRKNQQQGYCSNLSDGAQSFHTDPVLNPNVTTGNLSLDSSSPLIDSGTVVANITESFNGQAPDIGAIESSFTNPIDPKVNCFVPVGGASPTTAPTAVPTAAPTNTPTPTTIPTPTPVLPTATPTTAPIGGGLPTPTQAPAGTITVNPNVINQKITGWEGTAFIGHIIGNVTTTGQSNVHPQLNTYKNPLLDQAVNDLGINRVRLEIRSGNENPVDYWLQYINGQINYATYRARRYEIINDDNNPNTVNPSGFQFASWDNTIDTVVIPLRQRLQAKGEKLFVTLTYVDFASSAFEHKSNPAEFAEFILAAYQHLETKYGFLPDAIEILEPNTASWTATELGNAIVAAGNVLTQRGYTPRFVAPSHSGIAGAISYFDTIITMPGVKQYLKEFSYHRYNIASNTVANLNAIRSRAQQNGLDTAQLEDIGSGARTLHEDLKEANNSAWSQYVLAGAANIPNSILTDPFTAPATDWSADIGGNYYLIDNATGSVVLSRRGYMLRHYFKYITEGANRIDATSTTTNIDPLSFINKDGKYVTVARVGSGLLGSSFALQGLPAGTYGVVYTVHASTGSSNDPDFGNTMYSNQSIPDIAITTGQPLVVSIPRPAQTALNQNIINNGGVITVYQKTISAGGTCSLIATSAQWMSASNPVADGASVGLKVTGNGAACSGRGVAFDIRESDGGVPDTDISPDPSPATFSFDAPSNTWIAQTTWNVVYADDSIDDLFNTQPGVGIGPDYFFNANIVGDTVVERSSNNYLRVSAPVGGAQPTPTIAQATPTVAATGVPPTATTAPIGGVSPTAAVTATTAPATPTSTAQACSIVGSQRWISTVNPIGQGSSVTLSIDVDGDCRGKQLSLRLFEEDTFNLFNLFALPTDDAVIVTPAAISLNSITPTTVTTTWTAEYQDDSDDPTPNTTLPETPEYYFEAQVSGTFTWVRSQAPKLSVNQAAGAPITSYYGKQVIAFGLLGQQKVGETTRFKATNKGIYHGGGVTVDTSSTPNKVYVIDPGNNRILGFNGTGTCSNNAQLACAIDSDCGVGNTCSVTGSKGADIVLGQPNFNSGSCNGDNNIGFNQKPSSSSMCLFGYPFTNNTAEGWQRNNIDVDQQGNLYVPDTWNNRILKFNQPFSTDTSGGKGDAIADFVWGQNDFTSNGRNRGGYYGTVNPPDDHALWINGGTGTVGVTSRGVSVDQTGNIWVADTFNNRVLRFRPNSKNADLVLGQSNFTTRGCQANGPLNKMCHPTLARVHPTTGELFVLDEYGSPFRTRLLVFKAPFTDGMTAYKTITPKQSGPFTGWGGPDGTTNYVFESTGFIFNTYKTGVYANGEIWINEHTANRTLLIDYDGNIIKIIGARNDTTRGGDQQYIGCSTNIYQGNRLWWQGGSIGMDSANNIYLADETFHTVYRYALPYNLIPNGSTMCLPEANGVLFPKGPNTKTNDSLGESYGLALVGNQLLVRDQDKTLKVWNDYSTKSSGVPADHVIQQSFADRSYLNNAVDDANRLWIADEHGALKVYQLPLTSSSQPLKTNIALYWQDDGAPVSYKAFKGLAFDKRNKKLYINDTTGARILRVSNYGEFNNKLFVDMVIGQKNKTALFCNQAVQDIAPYPSPNAETLCKITELKFDNFSNLYVIDNDYECQGNNRIVVFLATDLVSATGLFPNLQAKRVFNAPDLNSKGQCAYNTVDKPGSPVSIAFNSSNNMVIGNDGYYGDPAKRELKQLWYYSNPLSNQLPDASIDLYMGTPGELAFDSQDNLLIQDHTWYKVLMINLVKDPVWLSYLPGRGPTPTAIPPFSTSAPVQLTNTPVPPTATPTTRPVGGLPTITPTRTPTPVPLTPTRTPTPTVRPINTPTPTRIPTLTVVPTAVPTVTPLVTAGVPTATDAPSVSPTQPIGGVSPTSSIVTRPTTPPQPATCLIAAAKWLSSSNPISDGRSVGLEITGSSKACVGQNIDIVVFEDDGFGILDDRVVAQMIQFQSVNGAPVAQTNWITQYIPDVCFGLPFCDTDSEYYFTSQAQGAALTARSATPDLEVTQNIGVGFSSKPQVFTTTNSAVISWATNTPSFSQVRLGFSSQYVQSFPQNPTNSTTNHSVTIPNLSPCTAYHYSVVSNSVQSADDVFRTSCQGSSNILQEAWSRITNGAGGVIDLLDSNNTGIEVRVPTQFSDDDADFQIKQLDKTGFSSTIAPPAGSTGVGDYLYHINAFADPSTEVNSFNKNISVTIKYKEADIAGVDENSLKIFRHDGTAWYQLSNCTIDKVAKEITCTTSSFSDFMLVGEPTAPTPTQQPAAPPASGGSGGGSSSGGGGGGGGGSGGGGGGSSSGGGGGGSSAPAIFVQEPVRYVRQRVVTYTSVIVNGVKKWIQRVFYRNVPVKPKKPSIKKPAPKKAPAKSNSKKKPVSTKKPAAKVTPKQ